MTDADCQGARPGALFSDRFWILKLGGALGLFALLCQSSQRQLQRIRPDIELSARNPELFRGKTVHTWGYKVLSATAGEFDVETKIGPVHITWGGPAPHPGDYVSFTGVITDRRRVEASALQVNEGYRWKRGLIYGLSIAVVLAFLWIVRDRFRWTLAEGLFRSRY